MRHLLGEVAARLPEASPALKRGRTRTTVRRCILFIGSRGVGKSSLLYNIKRYGCGSRALEGQFGVPDDVRRLWTMPTVGVSRHSIVAEFPELGLLELDLVEIPQWLLVGQLQAELKKEGLIAIVMVAWAENKGYEYQ